MFGTNSEPKNYKKDKLYNVYKKHTIRSNATS